jgi:hypothetical protein
MAMHTHGRSSLPLLVIETVSLLQSFRNCFCWNNSLTSLRSSSCASCESQNSVVSRTNSDSFATEEYHLRLDTFIQGPLEDDPLSVRPVNHTRFRPSSSFQHNFDLWLDRFFPYFNYPRRRVLTLWEEGHDAAGPFRKRPKNWLVRTRTKHVQFEFTPLIGIGTQFGDY